MTNIDSNISRFLGALGIDEQLQNSLPKDVLEGAKALYELQKIYAKSPESPKKDQLALAISEGCKLLIKEANKYKPTAKKVDEVNKPPKVKIATVGMSELKGDYYIGGMPVGGTASEFEEQLKNSDISLDNIKLSSVDDDNVNIHMFLAEGSKDDLKRLFDEMVKYDMIEFYNQQKPSQPQPPTHPTPPQTPTPPQPPTPPKQPKTPKPPKSQPPQPQLHTQILTCEEIKDAIKGLNLILKLGDDSVKDEIKQLKIKLKSQNCK